MSIRSMINAHLDRKAAGVVDEAIAQNARKPDGSIDEALARRISWEVGRRAEMGKRLDVYEPLRWAAEQTGLSFAVGAVLKYFTDHKFLHKDVLRPALAILGITTLLNNAIQLFRILPRYYQGLKGGVDTAIKLQREYAAPTNDQAFASVPQPASAKEWQGYLQQQAQNASAAEHGRA